MLKQLKHPQHAAQMGAPILAPTIRVLRGQLCSIHGAVASTMATIMSATTAKTRSPISWFASTQLTISFVCVEAFALRTKIGAAGIRHPFAEDLSGEQVEVASHLARVYWCDF